MQATSRAALVCGRKRRRFGRLARINPVSEPYSARSSPAKVESEASKSKLRASISVRASGPRAVSRCIGLEYNAMVSLTVWLIGPFARIGRISPKEVKLRPEPCVR